MAVGKDNEEIVKARIDKRDYRRIVLGNSLQALLISDPDTDKVNFSPISVFFHFDSATLYIARVETMISMLSLSDFDFFGVF